MAIETHTIEYDFGRAEAVFQIDSEKFTQETANITLEFYSWDYDKNNDPVLEVLKKYALECFQIATMGSFDPVIQCQKAFENKEGFFNISGSEGILLLSIEPFEFDEEQLVIK
ncbi:DUF2528 family protein [Chryseobacterium vrystaatense]|uniref:Uncharacterized protein n=1 Tax=Chryseobacterium vrystaatense TaxID=307480 RepID=A0ABR4UP44_9FLAO|nr:DUF2528 family protein [Chryseobacterium vrystaatense]KFF26891.1 hypothetical protein IW16_06335 [Chryseobacterium vrystaatense]